ncbi:hypothetical protein R1flu_027324 [Riccia fluitans]|uniref:Uncharacterized protein n=1 Tax=Riccia fluitans TaxID=41844 RepID=A0ABD1XIJ7_9MARC
MDMCVAHAFCFLVLSEKFLTEVAWMSSKRVLASIQHSGTVKAQVVLWSGFMPYTIEEIRSPAKRPLQT